MYIHTDINTHTDTETDKPIGIGEILQIYLQAEYLVFHRHLTYNRSVHYVLKAKQFDYIIYLA